MKAAVRSNAFNASDDANIERWLNDYYRRVWGLVDWPFRTPDAVSLAITQNDATPAMPADLIRVVEILDDEETVLAEISQEEYDRFGFSDTASTGKPGFYWMQARQAVLGPIPDANYTYRLRYERGLTHRDVNGAYVAGIMSAATDQLFWDGFEFLVIFGARAMGKKLSNNPTWAQDQDEADAMLLDMMAEWFPSGNTPMQFGRDMLGY